MPDWLNPWLWGVASGLYLAIWLLTLFPNVDWEHNSRP